VNVACLRLRVRVPSPVFALLLCVASASGVDAQEIHRNFPFADGAVNALASIGNTLYIGGGFGHVGPYTGAGVPMDEATGSPLPGFPRVRGFVYAIAHDGSGGWFIGGRFDSVGTEARENLAHITSALAVAAWNPGADTTVLALAVSGGTVYAGGLFLNAGGAARSRIAAIDAATGNATAWDPNANNLVRALAVSGSTVFAGGNFTTIGGQSRNRIAALSTTTGLATTWDANASNNVHALVVSGATLYAGGEFLTIGGQNRSRIAALGVADGLATTWDPNATSVVYTIALDATTVYLGGGFTILGGQGRNRIGAVDIATGLTTPWNPSPNTAGLVRALAVSGSTVYAGGDFTNIGGARRGRIAAIDAATGNATALRLSTDAPVYALAVGGGELFAGGTFRSVGTVRENLAAIDLTTGLPTGWIGDVPGVTATVNAIGVSPSGTSLFVGGNFFSFVGGQARRNAFEISTTTGLATSWNPDPDALVRVMAVGASTVYMAGNFTGFGALGRPGIGAVDAVTGSATAWLPTGVTGGLVRALAVSGSVVYVGGAIIKAVDGTTGAATGWDPNANAAVNAILVDGATVYVGGEFTSVGGQPRNRIAALDATTALATSWDPDADQAVSSLAQGGPTIYAGGSFTAMGGQPRGRAAALDATTGLAGPWNPNVNGPVNTWVLSGTSAYVGGFFTTVGGVYALGVAAIGDLTTPTQASLVTTEAWPDHVRVVWLVEGEGGVTVQRRTNETAWSRLGEAEPDGSGYVTYDDETVRPGRRYGYRLAWADAGGEVVAGEVWVEVPAHAGLALHDVHPNPSEGELSVSLAVPGRERVVLQLLDLHGRRVAGEHHDIANAGRHVVRAFSGQRFAPGVYVLQMRAGGRIFQNRVAVLR
jgi:hypothetical protein